MESLISKKKSSGFTLIELLIVVAIIGVLASVGVPAYQGYIGDAKVKSTTENHKRIADFIGASLMQCSTGVIVQLPGGSPTTVDCGTSTPVNAETWRNNFISFFDNNGWKNPHTPSEEAVFKCIDSTVVGRTCVESSGNSISVKTYPGDGSTGTGTLLTSQHSIE